MSDLSDQVFKDEDTDDNFLSYGDEQISAESLPDEVPESAEGQPAVEKKIEEIILPSQARMARSNSFLLRS